MNRKIKVTITIVLVLTLSTILALKNINFIVNLYNSFYRTLIEEYRYVLMLTGLKYTLLISMFSILLGTLLGIMICFLRINKNIYFNNIAKFFIGLVQGTPMPVLLLIFYYVIFGNVNVAPLLVAIIAFSIYFSAYIAEVFRGSIESINKNQIEASYSLGFSKVQTIMYILLPQALSYIIPVFKNETVSLIKLTSIAGYISIIDLTKATDIIRNRTYQAFFPLIFIALVYLIICNLVSRLMDMFYKKINPRTFNNKRVI